MLYSAIISTLLAASTHAGVIDFVLIGRDLEMHRVNLVSLNADRAVVQDTAGRESTIATEQFMALAMADASPRLPETGLLELTDGQRLPGDATNNTNEDSDVLAWRHPWLGRLQVPIDDIASVRFQRGAPLPNPGEADAVLLTNGDRLEGFIASLADPILLELEDGADVRVLEIPRRNVASVRMVSPTRQPSGRRAWLADGTIVDFRTVEVEESGRVRLTTVWHDREAAPTRLMIMELAAILFDSTRLLPLAGIQPLSVDGPVTRYEVPPPQVLNEAAVLGLSPIEYRGPLVARYLLPHGATRFAAEAVLPPSSRAWGDYELIVRDHHNERFRRRMNADDPIALINIELPSDSGGSELTIELVEGTYGGIQDRVILNWPMLLVE